MGVLGNQPVGLKQGLYPPASVTVIFTFGVSTTMFWGLRGL